MRRLTALVLAALFCASACGTDDDVTGLWQTPSGADDVLLPQFHAQFAGKLQLAVGQYAKDVSGVMLFYTGDFHKSRRFDLCPCVYVDDGELRSGVLAFSFTSCDGAQILVSLELTSVDGKERLEGAFLDPESGSELGQVVLEKVGTDLNVQEEELDLGCPD